MKFVTKAEFKEIYFRLGSTPHSGWNLDYWNKFFESDPTPGMKYRIEEPPTLEHTQMMIVSDSAAMEYRLFFVTDDY